MKNEQIFCSGGGGGGQTGGFIGLMRVLRKGLSQKTDAGEAEKRRITSLQIYLDGKKTPFPTQGDLDAGRRELGGEDCCLSCLPVTRLEEHHVLLMTGWTQEHTNIKCLLAGMAGGSDGGGGGGGLTPGASAHA